MPSDGRPLRRSYVFRDREVTLERTRAVGTLSACCFFVAVPLKIDHVALLTLVAFGTFYDVQGSAFTSAFPEDVAGITGFTPARMSRQLRELASLNLLTGSFAAGYKPGPVLREVMSG